MEEIRFTRPEPPKPTIPDVPISNEPRPKKAKIFRNFLKIIIGIFLLIVISLGIYAVRIYLTKADPNESGYYAAFLVNGQVYFGQLKEKNTEEFVIKNVYYLQLTPNGTAQQELSESRFSLVKLGDELHGPTDEMFINTKNLLFYEKLRSDSRVVQSIISSKKQVK